MENTTQQAIIAIEYPKIVAPVGKPHMTPEEAAVGHDTVTMVFEKPVLLTIDWDKQVNYPKGPHEVPVEWSDHFYLRAHGVTKYNRPIAVSTSEKKSQDKKSPDKE